MKDKTFTDEKIVKALEWCTEKGDCARCPYYRVECTDKLRADALALINRQKAEIARLHAEINDAYDFLARQREIDKQEHERQMILVNEILEIVKSTREGATNDRNRYQENR